VPWQVACEFIAASRKLAELGFTAAHAWQRLAEFLPGRTKIQSLEIVSPFA
jgi:hypothetical protein